LGENALALLGVWKNGGEFVKFRILTCKLRLDDRGETISRENRKIRNNLVKFDDNLPFSYFKESRKQRPFDEKWVKSATE